MFYYHFNQFLTLNRHKSSFLSLSAPLKYTNLVQNSKVELTIATAKMRAMSSRAVPVNIKLQVQDLPSHFSDNLIHQFKSNDTIWAIFKYFEAKSGINLTSRSRVVKTTETSGRLYYEAPVIKSFNCNISDFKDYKKTLSELGLTSKQENLRVRFELTEIPIEDALSIQDDLLSELNIKGDQKEIVAESYPNDSNNSQIQEEMEIPFNSIELQTQDKTLRNIERHTQEKTKTIANSLNRLDESTSNIASTKVSRKTSEHKHFCESNLSETGTRDVKVYLPSTEPRKIENSDDSTYTVSLNHSQAYQSQITKAAKLGDGPLLTKKLRRNMEIEKMKKILDIQIRIRFPDLTHIQATFKANETVGHVIDFIRSAIAFPDLPFKIFSNPPKAYYSNRDLVLVKDCKFGTRNLIYFEWDLASELPKDSFPSSGILKPDYLNTGTSILNSSDIAVNNTISEHSLDSSATDKSIYLNVSNNDLLTKSEKEKKLFKFIKTGRK